MTEEQMNFAEMEANLTKMAEENKKLAQALKLQEVQNKVAAYSESGKIVPAQEEALTNLLTVLSDEQEELLKAFMSHSPNVLSFLDKEYSEFDQGEHDHLLTPTEMAHKYLD
jgi:hypothetical protein